ncbi:hypothetical protein LOZ66_006892 [Ophidiomyces ophidiicola]|nr:hypothetical protein LOZ66_006892 [Ophidiomyces ophidiicola]
MAANIEGGASKLDRETTTPFHLKLFYRQSSFNHLSDFHISSPGTLPPHLQIYTWYSCTLRELAHLLTSCLPSLLPDPAVGTRLSFRLIYPDTKNQPGGPNASNDAVRGRYLSKDMGSIVISPRADSEGREHSLSTTLAGPNIDLSGEDADRTLQDSRFIIGDYIECAILPPLQDGSVAPNVTPRGASGAFAIGSGMRAFPPVRENGFGRQRHGGAGSGRGAITTPAVPSGEWRRGERIPDEGGRIYGRGNHRPRGRPY